MAQRRWCVVGDWKVVGSDVGISAHVHNRRGGGVATDLFPAGQMTASNGRCGRRGNSLSSYAHCSFVGILTNPVECYVILTVVYPPSTPAPCLTSIPLVVPTVTALHSLPFIELVPNTAMGLVA